MLVAQCMYSKRRRRKASFIRSKPKTASKPRRGQNFVGGAVRLRKDPFEMFVRRSIPPGARAIDPRRSFSLVCTQLRLAVLFRCLDFSDRFEHGSGEGAFGTIVPGRIVFCFGDVDGLDFAVDRVNRVAFAASPQSRSDGRAGMGQFEIECFRQITLWISHELQHGQPDFLVLGPSLHYGSVVDTIDNDSFDPFLSKRLLILEVVRDLLCGSSGGEGTGQTDQEYGFVLCKIG